MVRVRRDLASRLFQCEDGHPGIARPGLADRQAVQVRSGPDGLRGWYQQTLSQGRSALLARDEVPTPTDLMLPK